MFKDIEELHHKYNVDLRHALSKATAMVNGLLMFTAYRAKTDFGLFAADLWLRVSEKLKPWPAGDDISLESEAVQFNCATLAYLRESKLLEVEGNAKCKVFDAKLRVTYEGKKLEVLIGFSLETGQVTLTTHNKTSGTPITQVVSAIDMSEGAITQFLKSNALINVGPDDDDIDATFSFIECGTQIAAAKLVELKLLTPKGRTKRSSSVYLVLDSEYSSDISYESYSNDTDSGGATDKLIWALSGMVEGD